MEAKYQPEKFKELLLYIADKCESDPKFGATKWNKIMFYSDFISYLERGEPITGARYKRLEHGPGPAALVPVREEMIRKGELIVREVTWHGHPQKKPIALRPPVLDAFSGTEIAIVDSIITALWDMDATQVSDLSHHDLGWQLALPDEDIPYFTAFIESLEPA